MFTNLTTFCWTRLQKRNGFFQNCDPLLYILVYTWCLSCLQDQLSRFVPRLVQLLAEWTDKFPYDFRDERVMVHVREITHQCVSVEPAVRHQVSAMLQTLLHRLTALDKYETFLQQTGTDATVGSVDALSPVSDLSAIIYISNFIFYQCLPFWNLKLV